MQALNTKKSVLVLEDDPQWQTIVSQLLKKVDTRLEIRCVPSTHEAITLLSQGEHFDLVVADQYLDGVMTGMDLYKHMRAIRDNTSFVMLSGLDKVQFEDLTYLDAEFPVFVPKSKAFKTFSDVIRGEIGPLFKEQAPAHQHENALFLLVAVSAMVFAAAPALISAPSAAPSHYNSDKAPILFHEKSNVTIRQPTKHQIVSRQ